VFTHVDVVPMDGNRILRDQNVTISGQKIAGVEPASGALVPADATVVDGRGQFLMPGLGDMHAHLPEPTDPSEYMHSVLSLYVANGVTTVRCMRGFPNHLTARQEIEAGKLAGPFLFLAGPGLGGDSVTSPEDGARQVLEQKAAGWSMIKIFPGLSLPEYDAIMLTARRVGMRTGGHVPEAVGVEHALTSGLETIEHLDGYWQALGFTKSLPDETLRQMALKTREAGVWNTPTLAVFHFDIGLDPLQETLARAELEYLPQFQIDQWIKLFNDHVSKEHPPLPVSEVVQQNRERFLKALNDVGARILLGTDSPQLFNVPGFSIYREMEDMQQAGLSPYDVLVTGTKNVGEYLREALGTVTVGARADLILLSANPLDDVRNLRHQTGVMLRGRWMPHSETERTLRSVRERPGNYRLTLSHK
jgi:hypothetical protein